MKTYLPVIIALGLCLGSVSLHAQAPPDAQAAPPWQLPSDDQRCPSKWGAGDQRGSGNLMKPETVLRATKLIKTGEVFELGEVLSNDPKESFINGGRQFSLYTKPDVPKPNTRTENEELVVSELGQVGTQIDAFAHQMYGDSFYNCFKYADIAARNGYKKLGVENIGMLMSRGVMIDVAGLKGVDMLGDTYIITPDDLQQALAKEKLTLQPGDVVVINTGYGKLMGIKPKTKGDLENEAAGRETSIDRTRRLFYVTCSRAKESLAIVYYSDNAKNAREQLIARGWFSNDEIELVA